MKFETVRLHFLSEVLICCHPEILLPWQRDVQFLFSIKLGLQRRYFLNYSKTYLPFCNLIQGIQVYIILHLS